MQLMELWEQEDMSMGSNDSVIMKKSLYAGV